MELNYLAQKIFNKNSFAEINAVQLDELVNEFPYSSLLHFFYTKKLKDKNAFGYPEAVAKSALYFTNPHWLNHQLNDRLEYGTNRQNGELKPRVVIHQPESAESVNDNRYNEEDGKKEELLTGETPMTIDQVENPSELIVEAIEAVQPEEEVAVPAFDNSGPAEVEIPEEQQDAVTELPEHIIEESPIEAVTENPSIEEMPAPIVEITEPETVQLPEEEIKPAEELFVSTENENIIVHAENDFPEQGNKYPVQTEETMQLPENENQAVPTETNFENKGVSFSQQEQKAEEISVIPFEPLYTVDYFASQGIKLTAEEETKDDLGRKLKSFTEWLKSMKKLHPEKLNTRLDAAVEKVIQTEAEHSNDEANINTEAMAEVLLKQGRTDKAVEVYEKLSLLNPAKSAYFAAKIQEIKAY